jgi:hypothetical protein
MVPTIVAAYIELQTERNLFRLIPPFPTEPISCTDKGSKRTRGSRSHEKDFILSASMNSMLYLLLQSNSFNMSDLYSAVVSGLCTPRVSSRGSKIRSYDHLEKSPP